MRTFIELFYAVFLPFGVFSSMALDELSAEGLARKNLMGLALVLVIIYIMFNLRRRNSKFLSDLKHGQYTDISHQQRPLPKDFQRFLPDLTRLGFVRLGEVQRDTPLKSAVPFFVFIHQDRLTLAEISKPDKKIKFEFQSVFHDHSILVRAQNALAIQLPKYQSGPFPMIGRLDRAFAKHQQWQKKMSRVHGQLVPVHSIQDYINQQIDFREESAQPLLEIFRRVMLREIIPLAYVVGWIALFIILILAFQGYTPTLGILMFLFYLPTLPLVVWAHWSYRALYK